MRDKHRPCKDGMFSETTSKNKNPSLNRAQRWMRHEGTSVHQHACNYTESCHDKNKCVTLSPDVNSPVCKRSPDFLDLCSTVLQYKTKHSRGNIIKKHALSFLMSEYNWLSFTTTEGRGNAHADIAASINTKKTCLHPTTDSALRPIVQIVVSTVHSSTNGSDCC